MSLVLYQLFLGLYSTGIRLASLWNVKARQWVRGRRSQQLPAIPAGRQVVWMHCASLGEFEQGRPVLEAVKKQYPHCYLILTFFSPSGYQVRKNYSGADAVLYLPMDGFLTAKQFINAINPSLVLWVKYEYWYYYLTALQKRNIPVLLVSGIYRSGQPFFKWYGAFWKKMLGSFRHLFVQTPEAAGLLQSIGIGHYSVSGDTRFDRVLDIAGQWQADNLPVKSFCNGHPVIVAGSTWEEDEEILIHFARIHPHIRFIIAPHEVSAERIADLKHEFPQALLYSQWSQAGTGTSPASNVLIIDNIGMLSMLYGYASIAYIGGGFNQTGIHNILEAAVYAKPVLFGPVYQKFAEARALVDRQGAFSIENALELEAMLHQLLADDRKRKRAADTCGSFVKEQAGATQKIMEYIYKNRLLTN